MFAYCNLTGYKYVHFIVFFLFVFFFVFFLFFCFFILKLTKKERSGTAGPNVSIYFWIRMVNRHILQLTETIPPVGTRARVVPVMDNIVRNPRTILSMFRCSLVPARVEICCKGWNDATKVLKLPTLLEGEALAV